MSRYATGVDRRTFLSTLGVSVLAAPLAAEAQPDRNKPRIALLAATTRIADISGPNPKDSSTRAFLDGMRALGWIDGKNITIDRMSAEGHPDRFLAVAQKAVGLQVEVLVVSGWQPYVLAAQQATRTIPIVMVGMGGDPVVLGLAKSLSSPGGNVTGSKFSADPGTQGKRIELLRELAPEISRVAVLHQSGLGAGDSSGAPTESAARAFGLTLLWIPVDTALGITGPLAQVRQNRADALLVQGGQPWLYRRDIIQFATTHRLPAAYAIQGFVEEGGLMSYGANYDDFYRRAAAYVDKILKGVNPADLPIEQPTRLELVINLKTARALGLTIPQSLLLRVDEVIQ